MQHIDSAELRAVSRQIDSAHQGWRVWSWAALSVGQNWCVPSADRLIRPPASSEVEMITVSSLRRSMALLFPPWNLIDWINLSRCCYRTTWNVWQALSLPLCSLFNWCTFGVKICFGHWTVPYDSYGYYCKHGVTPVYSRNFRQDDEGTLISRAGGLSRIVTQNEKGEGTWSITNITFTVGHQGV